jgi:hypothetical protein
MNEGRLVSNRGLDIAMEEYGVHFEEYQVPHSQALHSRRRGPPMAPSSPARWRAGT